MNLNRYTEKAQEAIVEAQQLAERTNQPQVEPEHLLLTLLAQRGGVVPDVLRKMNVDPAAVAADVQQALDKLPKAYGGSQAGLSPRLRSRARQGRERDRAASRTSSSAPSICCSRSSRSRSAPPPPTADEARRHLRPRARNAGAVRGSAARDRSEPRGQVPGARALRPRPDRARAPQSARSGDRPRRGDPPRHPGAVAPHQEQPGAHRRARRRQDRRRRRAGAAHRPRRRARRAQGQADHRARHGRARRRREVSRRVRGSPQGGADRGHRVGRQGRALHRRAAHRRRRRRRPRDRSTRRTCSSRCSRAASCTPSARRR